MTSARPAAPRDFRTRKHPFRRTVGHTRRAMKNLILMVSLIAPVVSASAQSVDDLHLQIHGFATQAFLYTSHNNWNTIATSDGSASWTEAVVNLSAQPEPRLRVGVQARYLLLGNYGTTSTSTGPRSTSKPTSSSASAPARSKAPPASSAKSRTSTPPTSGYSSLNPSTR